MKKIIQLAPNYFILAALFVATLFGTAILIFLS